MYENGIKTFNNLMYTLKNFTISEPFNNNLYVDSHLGFANVKKQYFNKNIKTINLEIQEHTKQHYMFLQFVIKPSML